MGRPIKGFNYQTDKPEEHSPTEWRAIVDGVLAKGGFRHAEIGETFLHSKQRVLLYEIYSTIKATEAKGESKN